MERRETHTFARSQGAPRPVASGAGEDLATGTLVGRYVLLSKVGEGGAGTVYAAYDPELGRKVALKFLRPDLSREHPGLEIEARALASLSHPNIVTIFELGIHRYGEQEQRTFVAMELVEGLTFDRWLAAEDRKWTEVLDVALEAGRGLAAAHARGIVHRDFKPSNVMVTDEGGVRVLDFGLAEPYRAAKRGDRATRGAVLGTPGYLAPELLEGSPADFSSDQYGFCATLFEAFWGRRAAAGDHPTDRGRPLLPRWLQEAVLRGLRRSPARRHASMIELLQALDYRRRRGRRRRWVLAAAMTAAGALAAWVSFGLSGAVAARPSCDGAPERVAEVWGAPQRLAVKRSFAASGSPAADAAFERVDRALERYVGGWSESHADACRATHVVGEQSAQLLDQRMLCLNGALVEVAALVGVLEDADRTLVLRASEALRELPDLERCTATSELARRPELPRDPAARGELERIVARLAEQRALDSSGRPLSIETLEEIAAQAQRLGVPFIEAEALELAGRWQMTYAEADENLPGGSTENLLRRAFLAALRAGDRYTETLTAIDLVRLHSWEQDRQGAAEWWKQHAEALLASSPDRRLPLEARLYKELGGIAVARAEWLEAQKHYRRALELAEQGFAADDPRLIPYLSNALMMEPERVDALLGRTLAIIEESYGPWSPQRCRVSINHASNLLRKGRYEEARGWAQDCLASQERAYGERHRNMVYPLLIIAEARLAQDRPVEAEASLRRALPLAEEGFGPEHQMVGSVLVKLGWAHWLQLRPEAARDAYTRAAEIASTGHSTDLIKATAIGQARLAATDGGASGGLSLEALERLLPEDDQESVSTLLARLALGETYLAQGRRRLARERLEEALDWQGPPATVLHLRAEVRFALARALPQAEARRAAELVHSALPHLASGSAWTRRRGVEARAWVERGGG